MLEYKIISNPDFDIGNVIQLLRLKNMRAINRTCFFLTNPINGSQIDFSLLIADFSIETIILKYFFTKCVEMQFINGSMLENILFQFQRPSQQQLQKYLQGKQKKEEKNTALEIVQNQKQSEIVQKLAIRTSNGTDTEILFYFSIIRLLNGNQSQFSVVAVHEVKISLC